MRRRRGASLLNVMVFMLFSAVVTAQAFFFMQSSMDSVADSREIMNYRLRLSELVEDAKDDLKKTGTGEISHDRQLSDGTVKLKYSGFWEGTKACISTPAHYLRAWEHPASITSSKWNASYEGTYFIRIHDLDYLFDSSGFDRNDWCENYSAENSNMHKKLFAAMPHDETSRDYNISTPVLNTDGTPVLSADGTPMMKTVTETRNVITGRYYLIRAYAKLPANFFGRKLMYQVLLSRNEDPDDTANYHSLKTLSFQEVWF